MVVFSFLFYYFVLIPLSLLPFRILYKLSDVIFIILFRLTGYRKKVVLENLVKSFPHKSKKEIDLIAEKFYRHLSDLIVESIKIFTISESEIKKRVRCINADLLRKYYNEKKSLILAGGHFNNWEIFAVAAHSFIPHLPIGIYLPLTNKFFDGKMKKTRCRFGLKMISTREVKETFEQEKNNLTATIFAIDQSPSNSSRSHWTTFLNQETAVMTGTERYAIQYNYPVLFGRIKKTGRGYYETEFEIVSATPANTKPGEITEAITKLLEKDIIRHPEYWLWSHRRWKRKRLPSDVILHPE